jgi:hypothetical protein
MLKNAKQLQHARLSWHAEMSKLPGFDQHLPVKCFVFPLGAEHYQSLETALTDVGQHYLKVDVFQIQFCNDIAF